MDYPDAVGGFVVDYPDPVGGFIVDYPDPVGGFVVDYPDPVGGIEWITLIQFWGLAPTLHWITGSKCNIWIIIRDI